MANRAAFMTGIRKMEIREVPMPTAKSGQVVVKLEYVGICGSDVHYYEHGRIGSAIVNGDFILGHECAGVVTALGDGVRGLAVGDRVALEPGATCGECEYCKTGRYNLCPDVVFLATPPVQGCFENYIAFPANLAFKLPDNISTKEGALVEPLAVGLEAAKTGGVTLGNSVTILGAGCIGLVSMLASKAFGAADVTVVDVIEKRLEKALELGATRVINAAKQDVEKEIMQATGGLGTDIVMETAGSVKTTQQAPFLVKRGGTLVLVGMPPEDIIAFNFAKLMGQVADIRTIFRYKNLYPTAIKALASGTIDVSGIVTHEYAFEDIAEAFRVNIDEKAGVVKIVIKI
ncbi:MAG: NAD(P)-dependent alcohol dehydrogenase [Clostridiales bacterium]|nr:NAD(P)-dependent alcohol dehydrogenase [Clostridiales bacterium]